MNAAFQDDQGPAVFAQGRALSASGQGRLCVHLPRRDVRPAHARVAAVPCSRDCCGAVRGLSERTSAPASRGRVRRFVQFGPTSALWQSVPVTPASMRRHRENAVPPPSCNTAFSPRKRPRRPRGASASHCPNAPRGRRHGPARHPVVLKIQISLATERVMHPHVSLQRKQPERASSPSL